MSEWRITKFRGKFALTFEQNEKRRRYSLGTDNRREAEKIAPAIYAELTRPTSDKIDDLWQAYQQDKADRVITKRMVYSWLALVKYFGSRLASTLTVADSREYLKRRKVDGRSDGTILTELNHLRIILNWAVKQGYIEKAPYIEMPRKPEPRDRYLTKEEIYKLLDCATMPHIKLAIHLMLGTAARVSALLELTWDRVDFERMQIQLRNPDDRTFRKGRAVIPMNNTLIAALQEAKGAALTSYVIEWAGAPVKSLKKGIATTARNAKISGVSPHVFRHTAAVWMAEAGFPMSEIA